MDRNRRTVEDANAPRIKVMHDVRRGFVAMVPLWLGVAPFGVAFALLARTAGFDLLATAACSALIFAGSSQVAVVTLAARGAGPAAIVLTALLLNLRHVLYGLSLRDKLGLEGWRRWPLFAFLLTDEVYGVTYRALSEGRGGVAFLVGAGISLYAAFNMATLAGALLGTVVPNTARLGLDFIFPLTFLVLLLPLLRGRRQLAVAILSAVTSLVLSHVGPGGVAIVGAAVVAAGSGAMLDQGRGAR